MRSGPAPVQQRADDQAGAASGLRLLQPSAQSRKGFRRESVDFGAAGGRACALSRQGTVIPAASSRLRIAQR